MHEKIKLLMKLLHIENMDVARLLQVDVSLVSKWRSGVRSMLSNPEYLKRFSAYAVQVDRKNNYQTIRTLLAGDYDGADSAGSKELEVWLRDWLVSDSQKDALQKILARMVEDPAMKGSAHLMCWEGTQGRRQAIKYFTEYAITCSPHAEIISYTTESGTWFSEKSEYLHSWGEQIRDFLSRDNSLKIVHPVNRHSTAVVRSMAQWLPLHIRQDVDAFFLRRYDESSFVHVTIIVLAGKMAVCGMTTDLEGNQCRTYTTADPGLVAALTGIARRAVGRSVPLFRRYTLPHDCGTQLTHELCEAFREGAPGYFYNDLNWTLPAKVNPALLKDFLSQEELDQLVLPALEKLDEHLSKCQKYCLYDLRDLRQYLERDRVVLGYLSLLVGRRVSVPGSVYREYLRDYLQTCRENDTFHIGIADEETRELFGDISLWTGGNNTKSFFTMYQSDKVEILEIMEYSISASFLAELERVWHSTPYLKKDKDYIYRRYFAPLLEP